MRPLAVVADWLRQQAVELYGSRAGTPHTRVLAAGCCGVNVGVLAVTRK